MRPKTAPMGASAPSGTRISSTPLSSASKSVETLSVSSVTSVSPLATGSPAFLCHAATVAEVTDSPKLGVRMSLMGGRWVQDCARGPKAAARSLFVRRRAALWPPPQGRPWRGAPHSGRKWRRGVPACSAGGPRPPYWRVLPGTRRSRALLVGRQQIGKLFLRQRIDLFQTDDYRV